METKLLEVYKAHVKAEILLPWLTKIRFETSIYKRVWPPNESIGTVLLAFISSGLCGSTDRVSETRGNVAHPITPQQYSCHPK